MAGCSSISLPKCMMHHDIMAYTVMANAAHVYIASLRSSSTNTSNSFFSNAELVLTNVVAL